MKVSLMHQIFKEGIINIPRALIRYYQQLNISANAFVVLLYLIDHQQELQSEAYLQGVGKSLGFSDNEAYDYFSELLDAELIRFEMVKDEQGKQRDIINIEPLYRRLAQLIDDTHSETEIPLPQSNSLISVFEGEFGRQLTQMELMQVADWKKMDHFSDEMIILALQQAVLNQAISLKYIDRILLDWKKKNIRTAEEAKREIQSFNQAKSQREIDKTQNFESFKLPNIDWDNFK